MNGVPDLSLNCPHQDLRTGAGGETLRSVWPSVSIFGGARLRKGSPYYRAAIEIGEGLSDSGFSVITGGGPGIMEAANRGARAGKGQSIGLSIRLPSEQTTNRYVETPIEFNYFFARKVMFVKYACGIVGMPGGFGTLDEIFEALTLIQTRKIRKLPVILFGSTFWSGLIDWLEQAPLAERLIAKRDLKLFHVTDEPEEAVEIIRRHFERTQNGDRGNGHPVP